jgi:fluoride ion exporter CrcB/FEX
MIGAFARWGADGLFAPLGDGAGLLIANAIGACLLALISISSQRLSSRQRAFLGTGFCGAFTSVSALCGEFVSRLEAGDSAGAFGYLFISLCLALPLVWWILRWHPTVSHPEASS